jgi:hypothetical protein
MSAARASAAILLCFLLLSILAAAPAPKANPREQLKTAIPEAIRLLEAREYMTFLKTFVAPDDLKKITKDKPLDELATFFAENKAAQLLKALKSIKDAKPTRDDSGKKATYQLGEEIAGKKTITWVKVDKYWYIRN